MLAQATLVAFVATAAPDGARAFDGGTLGLRLVSEDPFALVFDGGGVELRVAKVPSLAPAPHTVLGWSVKDVRETVSGLAARGVVFERFEGMPQDEVGIWTSPSGARIAWFKDPDGNLLSVAET
jgi:catechol 2,3-dioxygenase-like lactoylglutathione lyase family enzyme